MSGKSLGYRILIYMSQIYVSVMSQIFQYFVSTRLHPRLKKFLIVRGLSGKRDRTLTEIKFDRVTSLILTAAVSGYQGAVFEVKKGQT